MQTVSGMDQQVQSPKMGASLAYEGPTGVVGDETEWHQEPSHGKPCRPD